MARPRPLRRCLPFTLLVLATALACNPSQPTATVYWYTQVNVSRWGSGSGTVKSNNSHYDCPGNCSHLYVISDLLTPPDTLTATPDAGSTFEGWSDACSAPNATHPEIGVVVLTLTNTNVACSARFERHSLLLSVSPGATVSTIAPGASMTGGSATVTLTGTGASTTAWSATVASTTPAGESWLQIVTPAGTGSGQLTWQRNTAGLSVGAHTATIRITAAGAVGSPFTITDEVDVSASPLTIQHSPGGTAIVGATAVTYSGVYAGAPAGTTYSWDFGDGTTASGATPAPHTFNTDAGNGSLNALVVMLTARNSGGSVIGTTQLTQNTRSLVGTWTLYDDDATPHSPKEVLVITAATNGAFTGSNAVSDSHLREVTGTMISPDMLVYTRWEAPGHTIFSECETLIADLTISPNTLTGNIVDCSNRTNATRAALWKRN